MICIVGWCNSIRSFWSGTRCLRHVALGLLLLLVSAGVVVAQSSPKPNEPFKLVADHDGKDTTEYRLLVDNVERQVKPLAQAFVAPSPPATLGTVTMDVPGLAQGTHVLAIIASGPGGSATSPTIAPVVNPNAPTQPTNLRIITITVTVQQP